MNITKLRAFITVVELGSLTKSAEKMGYSQPGIGKMIESLEKDLNVLLFTRNNSKLEITPEGKELYKYCKDIVKRYDRMIDATRIMDGVSDYMTISGANSIMTGFLPQLLREYSKEHMIFRMTLMEYAHESVVDSVLEGTVDMGVTSTFSGNNVTFIPLFKDPARLIVPLDHPLASNDEISVEALDGCDLIYIPNIGDDVIQAVKEVYDFKSASPFCVHSDVGAISMVDQGLGSYLISELQCIRLGKHTKKIKFKEPVYRTMGIGLLKHKLQISIIKEMIQFATDFSKAFEEALWMR